MNDYLITRNMNTAEFLNRFLTHYNKSESRLFTELKTTVKCKLGYPDGTGDTYYIAKDFFLNKIYPVITPGKEKSNE